MASEQSRIFFALAACWGVKVRSTHGGNVQNIILGDFRFQSLTNHLPFLQQKKTPFAWNIRENDGVFLRSEEEIVGKRREHFKDLLNPVAITPSDINEVHLGEENTISEQM